jgi:ADP-ribose pyrophosphatase YjhB (NUDIX family)
VDPARFCLWCGTPLELRAFDGKQLPACPSCDFVLWPDPKLATAVVVEAVGGIVVGKRSIDPGRGLWCLPGGFVDDHEHPAQAAMRECQEEIGAAVIIAGPLGIYHVRRAQRPHLVVIGYRAQLAAGARAVAAQEMDEVGVFPADSLPPLAFTSHQEAVNDWLRIGESSTTGNR